MKAEDFYADSSYEPENQGKMLLLMAGSSLCRWRTGKPRHSKPLALHVSQAWLVMWREWAGNRNLVLGMPILADPSLRGICCGCWGQCGMVPK